MSQKKEPLKAPKTEDTSPILGGLGTARQNFGKRSRDISTIKPKNFTKTLQRLWQQFAPERANLGILFIFIIIDSLLTLFVPYLLGTAIDALSAASGTVNFSLLETTILILTVTYLADALLTFIQGYFMIGMSGRMVMKLRFILFAKLQKLPLAFFDRHPHGELMSRLSNDIDNVSSTISYSTTQLISGSIALFGSLIMMFMLSRPLTLVVLLIVPLIMLLARTIAGKTSLLFREQQVQLGKLNGHIEETISGLEIVKAFNHENKVIADFTIVNEQLYKVGLKAQIWSGFLMPLTNVINNLGFAFIAIVGGILAINDQITIGAIASFIGYSRQFSRPLNDLANIFNLLQSGVAGAERVFEILDEQEEVPDVPNAITLENPEGHVVFENVSFGYRSDVPILQNINFEAPAGSSTALVGPTGAGKTTIVNLITRFYDVTSGRVLLDGRDIRDYTRDSLRKCFGIVLQDTYLFSGTIRENIRYGKPDASDEDIKKASAMANADTFIGRLPEQYDTVLSENGSNLSHGERQLLAIARVLLATPSILILDEATSSIDTRTELHIQDALLHLMQGRTSFIIAHRLNTIHNADTIMTINHGVIVEQGYP